MQSFIISLLSILAITTDAKLRGVTKNDDLKQRATNPVLRSDVRGKTVRELGVLKGMTDADKMTEKKGSMHRQRNNRSLQGTGGRSLHFFTVRE